MKRCPECRRDYYDETLLYCLDDGTALLDGPASVDEPLTEIFSEKQNVAKVSSASGSQTRRQSNTTDLTAIYHTGRDGDPEENIKELSEMLRSRENGTVRSRSNRIRLLTLGIVVLVLVGAFYGYRYFDSNNKPIESIAVMPFVNASGDVDNEYLSDGMTETLISSLSQVSNLSVKARGSVFQFKGQEIAPQEIGRKLNVQAVLNGRIVERGEVLTLFIELVETATEKVLWSEQYNRKQTDLVSLQNEIARDIAIKLRTRLSGREEQRVTKIYTANPEAYQLYLRGRYHWNKRTGQDLEKAAESFNRAIEIDPNYALAYAGLADAYVLFSGYNVAPPNEAYPKGRAAAMKAIELDGSLSEAHTTLADIKSTYEWDFAGAERGFKHAIELDPNYPTARQWYGEYLSAVGRYDEALAEMKRAQELDPLSLIINIEVGAILMFRGENDAAIEQLLKTNEMDASFAPAYASLGFVYIQKLMYAEAISEHQKAIDLDPGNSFALSGLGYSYAKSGRKDEARKVLDRMMELSAKRYVSPTDIASIHAGLGENDKAFDLLEKGFSARDDNLLFFKVHPPFESLRSDPRFADLARRVGIPQ